MFETEVRSRGGVTPNSLRNTGGVNRNVTSRYIGGEGGQKWPKSALRNFWTAPENEKSWKIGKSECYTERKTYSQWLENTGQTRFLKQTFNKNWSNRWWISIRSVEIWEFIGAEQIIIFKFDTKQQTHTNLDIICFNAKVWNMAIQTFMKWLMLSKYFLAIKSNIWIFIGHFAKVHGIKCWPAPKVGYFRKKLDLKKYWVLLCQNLIIWTHMYA